MNRIIDELAKQATDEIMGVPILDHNRFAELIIQECIEWCNAHATINGTAQQVAESITNHFGVD